MPFYNSKLKADKQITSEEKIALLLREEYGMNEDAAAQAGRDILLDVLIQYRPDLFLKGKK